MGLRACVVVTQEASQEMRRWWVLSLLMVVALPAWPAKRVSAAQLEQILSGLAAAHKADPDVAREIGFLEPSERISDATLDRLNRAAASRRPILFSRPASG
jgi:hypothetical protein